MRTNDLIAVLTADKDHEPAQQGMLWAILACAIAAGAVAFFVLLYPRHDFMQAAQTLRFDFKVLITFVFATTGFLTLRHAVRPEFGDKPFRTVLLTAPVLLLIAVGLELIALPSSDWVSHWFGHNWMFCMTFIPILSLGPLAVLLITLRNGASTAPMRTGAVAGLLAGGIGSVFYALHCPDDSPLFVASWYTIAIAGVTAVGALAGRTVLRW